jgi:hypothetical protein
MRKHASKKLFMPHDTDAGSDLVDGILTFGLNTTEKEELMTGCSFLSWSGSSSTSLVPCLPYYLQAPLHPMPSTPTRPERQAGGWARREKTKPVAALADLISLGKSRCHHHLQVRGEGRVSWGERERFGEGGVSVEGRKLQKTTTFEVRVSKNHHFSEKFQKTTSPPTNYCKKTLITHLNVIDTLSDRGDPPTGSRGK